MTIGIYSLNFEGTEGIYVGQSINIEDRYRRHIYSLKKGTSTYKLQNAFNKYGIPELRVLLECTPEELNQNENEAIALFNSDTLGFNINKEAGAPLLFGENSGTATETNDTYLTILKLLVQENPSLSCRQIQELTGVSISVIRHIQALESHRWLESLEPNLYQKLIDRRNNLKWCSRVQYPKIVSPDGKVYEVPFLTEFARQHNLLQPKLQEVLAGTRNFHRGWHLETTAKKQSVYVRSPDNEVYEIKPGERPTFCKSRNLTPSLMWKVITGKSFSHKGWTLAQPPPTIKI